jgi:hypothetical protein
LPAAAAAALEVEWVAAGAGVTDGLAVQRAGGEAFGDAAMRAGFGPRLFIAVAAAAQAVDLEPEVASLAAERAVRDGDPAGSLLDQAVDQGAQSRRAPRAVAGQ